MFENVGQKIKTIALALCFLGITATIVGGFAYLIKLINASADDVAFLIVILMILGGCLTCWIISLLLYGYGEIVDSGICNDEQNEELLVEINNIKNILSEKQNKENNSEQITVVSCSVCGAPNVAKRTVCWRCEQTLNKE